MKFGPVPPKKLPKQDSEKVLRLAERWQRATWAHERWATPAKEAVNFFEGRQYTDDEMMLLRQQKRPALKFNIIAPIVRLIIGYHSNNKTDVAFSPIDTRPDNEAVAEALTKIEKSIAMYSGQEYIDPEVFLDGLITGRGWFDTRLCFEDNDLGEVKTVSLDPFAVKVDPDADTYDPNESASFLLYDKRVSVDEIEAAFGKGVADLITPYVMGRTPIAPVSSMVINDEVAPVRYFGMREDLDNQSDYWDSFYALAGDFVDTHRKTIRITEAQYKVREMRNVVIDLETGDKKILPKEWGRDKIEKILLYAETVGNPCIVQRRMVERYHWTTMCADVLLYDKASMYDGYTLTGFFPYFRRGVTRGVVEDLIDPQREKNKSRSNRIEIESKTANGGWLIHEEALDPVQEANLRRYGSHPGVIVKWKGERKPDTINASPSSGSYDRLEAQSDEDIRRISGVNESALGEQDVTNQSGRAIEARQRQAVISVKMYMDAFRRSKQLLGRRHLSLIQNYYTEPRIYRVIGDDGKMDQVAINQVLQDPVSGGKRILHDVTVGKYSVTVDDTPINATFQAAQFEEMMQLLEKISPVLGPALPMLSDLIIGMSSLPQKQEWIQRLQQIGAVPPAAPPQQGAALVPPQGVQPAPTGAPAPVTPAAGAVSVPPGVPVPQGQPAPPQQGLPPNVVPIQQGVR